MSHEVPTDRRYVASHEWVEERNGVVRIGISDFAQDELGDVVFVELPQADDELEAEEAFGVIESIKAVSDLYAPIGGTVAAINETVMDQPELVNEDPYGEGWMIELEPDDADALDGLMTAEEYQDQLE